MSASRGVTAGAEPVEKFKPTSGVLPGILGLLLVGFGITYVAFEVQSKTGLRIALGLAFFGVLVWMTQLRSRATAYPRILLLRNSLVDVSIPLRLIEGVSVRRTLNVWAGGRRHVCIGIGRSMNSLLKESRTNARPLGLSRMQEYAKSTERPVSDQDAAAYEVFVVNRIEELAEAARSSAVEPDTPERVRRVLAWPELIALAVTGSAFLLSLK